MEGFSLHHTRRSGPMDDGVYIHRCEWCGVSRREIPIWLTERRMREASRLVTAGTLDHSVAGTLDDVQVDQIQPVCR